MKHENPENLSDIEGYLKEHEHKELLRFIACGSVDDGKSTLIGRLLHDSKTIFDDQLASLEADSRRSGTTGEKIDLALLVDGLQSEREQGITIDVAYRYFTTDKRKFIIADTPGHEQYTRNMATGASTADLAIILVDARYGIVTQTRRHSYIVSLLGIRNVVLAVNKMDLVGFDRAVFESIDTQYREFAENLGIRRVVSVPVSALEGDNVVVESPNTPWYEGLSLINILEEIPLARDTPDEPFRFPVQYVNRPNLDFRGFAGTVVSGSIRIGEEITVYPSKKRSSVKSIVTYDGALPSARRGEAVTITLNDEIDVGRGSIIVRSHETMACADTVDAYLVWMDEETFSPGKSYCFKRSTSATTAFADSIEYRIDVNTQAKHPAGVLKLNDIALVRLVLGDTVAFDTYENNRDLGGFLLIDKLTNQTVAAGMIVGTHGGEQNLRATTASAFEIELNALVRKHFPHWNAAVIA